MPNPNTDIPNLEEIKDGANWKSLTRTVAACSNARSYIDAQGLFLRRIFPGGNLAMRKKQSLISSR